MRKIKYIRRGICLVLALVTLFLASCSVSSQSDEDIEIICTVYPQYDWVKSIVGEVEGVSVSLLVTGSTDVHGYQPTVDDMIRLRESDAVVLVGGESDAWVFEELKASQSEAIVLMELEGMTLRGVSDECVASEHEHEHDHEHYHNDVIDEHVWLSVANARTSCKAICEWLCEVDAENAAIYRANTERYVAELDSLDARFKELAQEVDTPVIFADRFPFVYLFEDYGISYYAAFAGCSTDSEASFDTVARLAERLGETGSRYVAVSETSDKSLAHSVIGAAGVESEIIALDSMQSVTERQINDGYGYISAMEENFRALSKMIKE